MSKNKEKDRLINSLNIYSTHASERKQLRSRTTQERAQTASDNQNILKEINNDSAITAIPHPYTDVIMASIMQKTSSPFEAPQIIHKPNLSYDKKSKEGLNNQETVEDILARRMRDHITVNGPPKVNN